jgi:hypothetical protein
VFEVHLQAERVKLELTRRLHGLELAQPLELARLMLSELRHQLGVTRTLVLDGIEQREVARLCLTTSLLLLVEVGLQRRAQRRRRLREAREVVRLHAALQIEQQRLLLHRRLLLGDETVVGGALRD